jgi:CpeT/CpcT family (DUF1001)
MRKILILSPLLSGCATLEGAQRDFAVRLSGTWDNSAQMTAAPEALKRPPVAGGDYEWIDGQYATFFPVKVPALTSQGARAIYLVWRRESPTGPISRQRLWVFRNSAERGLGMDFYAFKDGKAFETATHDSDAFKAITLNDLTAYGPLCTLPVVASPTGWSASIPSTCAITARSGRKMVLSADITLDGDTFSYREQGILESGAVAFKVPGGPAYRFVRTGR